MKQNSKLASALLSNLAPKVFSLLAATFIILTLKFVNTNNRTVRIPLDVYLPEGYKAESWVSTDVVDVTITGDDKVIYLVDPSQIKAYVDFSDVDSAGIASRPVRLIYQEDIFRADKLTVTPDPSLMRILFKAE